MGAVSVLDLLLEPTNSVLTFTFPTMERRLWLIGAHGGSYLSGSGQIKAWRLKPVKRCCLPDALQSGLTLRSVQLCAALCGFVWGHLNWKSCVMSSKMTVCSHSAPAIAGSWKGKLNVSWTKGCEGRWQSIDGRPDRLTVTLWTSVPAVAMPTSSALVRFVS